MRHRRPTVADLLSMKGKRQLTMLRVMTLEEAEAAEKARIDLVSVPSALLGPEFREAAPSVFALSRPRIWRPCHRGGLYPRRLPGAEGRRRRRLLRRKPFDLAAHARGRHSRLRPCRAHPFQGHLDRRLSRRRQDGGKRALEIWRQTRALEEAGAFAAEIELVPGEVAAAISARISMLMLSMGAGTGCDAQYLFAEDVLGANRGHYPRHAKTYRNFAAEYDRLQQERIAAFSEFAFDVRSGAYPEKGHLVGIEEMELGAFLSELEGGR